MAIIVGSTSFLLSYVALRDVSSRTHAVPENLAWAVPVCIDGGILAASACIWSAAYLRRRRDLLAFVTVAVLLATSVMINIQHAGPSLTAKWIASLPPLVLLACLELVANQHRRDPEDQDVAIDPAPRPAPARDESGNEGDGVVNSPANVLVRVTPDPDAVASDRASGVLERAGDSVPAVVDLAEDSAAPGGTLTLTPLGPASVVEEEVGPTPQAARTTSARRPLRIQADTPGVPSAADRVRASFEEHVAAGGDPDDTQLATAIAERHDVTAQYVRRVLKPLRESSLAGATR